MKRIDDATWKKVLTRLEAGDAMGEAAEAAGVGLATFWRRRRADAAFAAAVDEAMAVAERAAAKRRIATAAAMASEMEEVVARRDELGAQVLAIVGGAIEPQHATLEELGELLRLATRATVGGVFRRSNLPKGSAERFRLSALLSRVRYTTAPGLLAVMADPRAELAAVALRKSERRELRRLGKIADRTAEESSRIESLLAKAGGAEGGDDAA